MKGLSAGAPAVLFGVFFATGTVVQPLSGLVGERLGERRGPVGVPAVAGGALAALPFVSGLPALVALAVALGVMLGRSTLALTYLTTAFTTETRGTGLGTVRTGYRLLGATAPLVIGLIADSGRFDEAFLRLAAVFGLMIP